jgi:hypothetical protein
MILENSGKGEELKGKGVHMRNVLIIFIFVKALLLMPYPLYINYLIPEGHFE